MNEGGGVAVPLLGAPGVAWKNSWRLKLCPSGNEP